MLQKQKSEEFSFFDVTPDVNGCCASIALPNFRHLFLFLNRENGNAQCRTPDAAVYISLSFFLFSARGRLTEDIHRTPTPQKPRRLITRDAPRSRTRFNRSFSRRFGRSFPPCVLRKITSRKERIPQNQSSIKHHKTTSHSPRPQKQADTKKKKKAKDDRYRTETTWNSLATRSGWGLIHSTANTFFSWCHLCVVPL